jgi:hypothetical protein
MAEEKRNMQFFFSYIKNLSTYLNKKTYLYMYPKAIRGSPLGATPSRTIVTPPGASSTAVLMKYFGKKLNIALLGTLPHFL